MRKIKLGRYLDIFYLKIYNSNCQVTRKLSKLFNKMVFVIKQPQKFPGTIELNIIKFRLSQNDVINVMN